MFRTLTRIAAWVFLVVLTASAQDTPPQPVLSVLGSADLTAASEQYVAALQKAKGKVLDAFALEDKVLTANAKLKAEEKLKRLDELAADKDAFESTGKLPQTSGLKKAVDAYEKDRRRAKDLCAKVFDAAASKAIKTDRKAAQAILDAKSELFETGQLPAQAPLVKPNTPTKPQTEELVFSGHTGKVSGVRFSPHARTLLTCSDSQYKMANAQGKGAVNSPGEDNTIRLWSLETGEQTALIKDGLGQKTTWQVQGLTLSPDGQQFGVSTCRPSADYCMPTVTVWSIVAPKRQHYFPLTGRSGVWPPWFGKDGKTLYAFRGDTTVHVFDLKTGKESSVIQLDPTAGELEMPCACLSVEKSLVYGGMKNGLVRVWSLSSGKEVRQLTGHSGEVLAVALSPDQQRLASCGIDGTARVWEIATGKEVGVCRHGGRVSTVTFAGGADRIVTGGDDRCAVLWDATGGQELKRFAGHSEAVLCLDISSDGRLLATGSADKSARTWLLPTR
jgi:WD40 repeat protein